MFLRGTYSEEKKDRKQIACIIVSRSHQMLVTMWRSGVTQTRVGEGDREGIATPKKSSAVPVQTKRCTYPRTQQLRPYTFTSGKWLTFMQELAHKCS